MKKIKTADTPELRDFTVFCRDEDGDGTTWIDTVKAATKEQASIAGRLKCAADWGRLDKPEYGPTYGINVIGLAAGDVDIIEWND